MKKSLFVLTAALSITFTGVAADPSPVPIAAASQRVSPPVYIDGKVVSISGKQPVIINGTTFVPVRFLSEKLGASVAWQQETQSIFIRRGNYYSKMQLGNHMMKANGEWYRMSKPPFAEDGYTMVPINALQEALGLNVFWDSKWKTVQIIDKGISYLEDKGSKSVIYLNHAETQQLRKEIDQYKNNTKEFNKALDRYASISKIKNTSFWKQVKIRANAALQTPYVWNKAQLEAADKGHGIVVEIYYDAVTKYKSQTDISELPHSN